MTDMPTWPPGNPEASARPGTVTGQPGPYRSRLGALQAPGRETIPEISLQFSIGILHVLVETAGEPSLDQLVRAKGKRLGRAGYSCQPPYPAEFAGFPDGLGRVVAKKKKGRRPAGEPQLQLYARPGPYSLTLTVPQAQAGLTRDFGPVTIDQVAPPAIVPIVRMAVPNGSAVGERLILTERGARLTAMVTQEPVTASSDQFAMSCLQAIASRMKDMAVNEGQPDVFLGGQYCIRHTFVIGGVKAGSAVRSEHWWAGVVAGYGVQIFVVGTKSIIDPDQARRLKDTVVLIPSG
jgi:hypothetical protein